MPRPFLYVFQNSEYPGHTPLQGYLYWERWNLLEDCLFWLVVFLCAALICTIISRKVWGRVRPGIIILVCMCLPLVLWILYLRQLCGNYFFSFYYYYVA